MSTINGGPGVQMDRARASFEAYQQAQKTPKPGDAGRSAFCNLAVAATGDAGGIIAWVNFIDDATANFTGTVDQADGTGGFIIASALGTFTTDQPRGPATWQAFTTRDGSMSVSFKLADGNSGEVRGYTLTLGLGSASGKGNFEF